MVLLDLVQGPLRSFKIFSLDLALEPRIYSYLSTLIYSYLHLDLEGVHFRLPAWGWVLRLRPRPLRLALRALRLAPATNFDQNAK